MMRRIVDIDACIAYLGHRLAWQISAPINNK